MRDDPLECRRTILELAFAFIFKLNKNMLNYLYIDPDAAAVLDNPALPRHTRHPREQESHAANGLQRALPRLLAFKQLQM